ncbi:hypothetical protein BLD25_03810 [Candidatus Gracilibacteria bacterium GN02-872]|nr:hypothetical protein BLD25_03810 [Candidatus Gracilibacteria bacterium GN02-872]
MNKFAGNITLKGSPEVELDFDFVESLAKDGNKNIFFFGETELSSSKEIIDSFRENFEILHYDISIESEHKIEIIGESYEEGIYELATFEGAEVSFEEIFERFSGVDEVVCVRESEISKKFGNKKIKVDFVY